MAASSTNSSNESDNLNNKSDQTLESFDESKKILPISSEVEKTINKQSGTIVRHRSAGQGNDLSPHLIEKQSIVPLSASCSSDTTLLTRSLVRKQIAPVDHARPFEEILVGQPTTDVPPGTYTKPGAGDSLSTKRP